MPTRSAALLKALESFDWEAWRAKLRAGVGDIYEDAVDEAGQTIFDAFALDDAFTSAFMTQYVGERIVQLDAYTRERVAALIVRILDSPAGAGSTFELAILIRDAIRETVEGYQTWRAARIARTESAIAYNHGATLAWKQAGGEWMYVTDGDQDGPCAEANGSIWPIERCLDEPIEHPNCVRSFAPANGPEG